MIKDEILDQRLFVLPPDKFEAFRRALDAPPKPNEKLRALLARKPAWEK